MARAGKTSNLNAPIGGRLNRRTMLGALLATPFVARPAFAAETLNAYSIWPENYARPMMEAFEKASGIQVKFVRFSSGEALARVTAEKNNPQIDVLFGGPGRNLHGRSGPGHCSSPTRLRRGRTARALQGQGRRLDRDRRRSAGVHDQHAVPEAEQSAAAGVLGRSAQSRLQGHAADGRRAHVRHRGHAHLLHPAGATTATRTKPSPT